MISHLGRINIKTEMDHSKVSNLKCLLGSGAAGSITEIRWDSECAVCLKAVNFKFIRTATRIGLKVTLCKGSIQLHS